MLPRKSRLTTRLFDEVIKKSMVLHSAHLSLRINRLSTPSPSRFSFVVSKKVDTRATERNLIKRRLRTIIHHRLVQIPQGYYCIFFAKSGSVSLKFSELEKEVEELLGKLRR